MVDCRLRGTHYFSASAALHQGDGDGEAHIEDCWSWVSVYGHTTLKAPVLVRSLKLSNVGPGQYLDG